MHSSLGTTPAKRWESSLKSGRRLRYFSPVQLDQAFMHFAERTVSKYGVISFNGNQYAIDGRLVNKKIAIRYNPFHLGNVHVYYQDKYYGLARVIDLKKEKHKSVAGIEEDPAVDSTISREYLKNIKSNYQDYLKEQLNTPLEDKVQLQAAGDHPEEKTAAEVNTTDHIAAEEKVQALKRQEFVEIISTALEIKNLSYAEKGKLYELWQTFKEFNRDLLIDIVDDIRLQIIDFFHEENAQGKFNCVIIDEAHSLSIEMFDELRSFYDDGANFSLILAGLPQLLNRNLNLSMTIPMKQRVSLFLECGGLSLSETKDYVKYHFNAAGIQNEIIDKKCYPVLHSMTSGIPRKINQACYVALLESFKSKKSIITDDIFKKVNEKISYT
ncbi:Mu transposase C-terminal domain-containing protein [Halanaerobium sp. MA284_MarDTE_T2]|uniref:Mu transposase C-terminal domain-containing protein n=1 Tax=Halanaerobium sp. MA284_MarDTE_T2 TaxID=2183913 RepID=UPI000DF2F303|nr:Mu transposase C-terminal domain-containing protein [Halanaerobium sp. MA284_MarDTE_T2]RCW49895.1 AAA domain-containing protein [Halanaerobium sp. MA284_MarDTE_T2]